MSISKEILAGCKLQNPTCQEMTYTHYYGFLMSVGLRYINDTSDVKFMVNESFFKAFTKIEQYDITIPFEIWIRRIMINTCIDFLRKNKKEKFNISLTNEASNYLIDHSSVINYAELNIEKNHLANLLKKVPETSRKVFSLFAIEGYSHKEIAELLDINEGTSKWHTNNARQILKAQLGDYVQKTKKTLYAK